MTSCRCPGCRAVIRHDYRDHAPEYQAACPFNPANRHWHRLPLLFRALGLTLVAGACGLLLALLTGCADPFAVQNPVPFHPPASYRAVWDSAQACTGIHKRFEVLHFLVADRLLTGHQVDAGHTEGTTIWIRAGFESHPMVIKHEMIHALLLVKGHPPVFTLCHATWTSWHGGPDLAMTP